jgi:hypothetical protein
MREYNREYRAQHGKRLSAQTAAWKRANRERVRANERAAALRIKLATFALFGSVCCKCGFSDHRALQLDHIHGAGSEDRRASYRAGTALYRAILRSEKDRSLFQLLCANCNWIKRVENDECGAWLTVS